MSKKREARAALRQVANPPNPWHETWTEPLGPPPEAALTVLEDSTRSALSKNDSPDIFFDYGVNPYRGCYHGCAYCYARPTHEYLDLGAGTDFERKLIVKPRIAELLRAAFMKRSWTGALVVFSGNTDCYQPLEASYGLTRACLEVCLAFRNPVSLITKSPLIERDVALLAELASVTHCVATVSIPFDDVDTARAMEPYVASPARRYKTIARLAAAGVPVGVNVAPIIPGLNDEQAATVLERAREAGARFAGRGMVRLPGPVAGVFERRLRAELPLRADKVMSQIRACRDGALHASGFGARMAGTGERWQAIVGLFDKLRDKLGYEPFPEVPDPSPFRRPREGPEQMALGL